MQEDIPKEMIVKWLKGWALSRELPLPEEFRSGFKLGVGYEKQKTRYVFPKLNEDFIQLANAIVEPWVYLKVCATPAELKELLPPRWAIQPQGYMMTNFKRMVEKPTDLADEYNLGFEEYNTTHVIRIIANNGDVAAIGRVVLVDDLAVYDRIATQDNHKRKGLATVVMKELEKIALSKGIYRNCLVATEAGKLLYESLGWELYSLYTSVVIPGS